MRLNYITSTLCFMTICGTISARPKSVDASDSSSLRELKSLHANFQNADSPNGGNSEPLQRFIQSYKTPLSNSQFDKSPFDNPILEYLKYEVKNKNENLNDNNLKNDIITNSVSYNGLEEDSDIPENYVMKRKVTHHQTWMVPNPMMQQNFQSYPVQQTQYPFNMNQFSTVPSNQNPLENIPINSQQQNLYQVSNLPVNIQPQNSYQQLNLPISNQQSSYLQGNSLYPSSSAYGSYGQLSSTQGYRSADFGGRTQTPSFRQQISWPFAGYFPIVVKDPFLSFYNAFTSMIEYGPSADICRKLSKNLKHDGTNSNVLEKNDQNDVDNSKKVKKRSPRSLKSDPEMKLEVNETKTMVNQKIENDSSSEEEDTKIHTPEITIDNLYINHDFQQSRDDLASGLIEAFIDDESGVQVENVEFNYGTAPEKNLFKQRSLKSKVRVKNNLIGPSNESQRRHWNTDNSMLVPSAKPNDPNFNYKQFKPLLPLRKPAPMFPSRKDNNVTSNTNSDIKITNNDNENSKKHTVHKDNIGDGIFIQRMRVRHGGIAIAGPGGIATAGDGGTAIVGPDGLAYTQPNGLAIAGPGAKVISVPSRMNLTEMVEGMRAFGKGHRNITLPEGSEVVATGPVVYYNRKKY